MSEIRRITLSLLKPFAVIVIVAVLLWLLYSFIVGPLFFHKTEIIHVIDPDSLIVSDNGVIRAVQLIGVDAPETPGDTGITQCYSRKARKKLITTYLGKNLAVTLISDNALGDKDIYGRLLRYVKLADGTLLNELLLKDGLAKEFHMPGTNYQRLNDFKILEETAQQNHLGLWDPTDCDGNF